MGQAISVEIVRYEKRVILVFDDLHIDDLHIIESNVVLDLIQSLVDHAPNNLHLMFLSRSRPRLQISRLQLASKTGGEQADPPQARGAQQRRSLAHCAGCRAAFREKVPRSKTRNYLLLPSGA
ncbi:MAG: hypothetical protein NTZ50_00325 [Chloroflexi bacterium]|nr:hypothetical protein [Chloroflexota bacterium]